MSRWLVRAAVSLTAAAILLTLVPVRTVLAAMGRISIWTWAASLAIFFAGHYLNAVKLRLILGPAHVPLTTFVQAQYAGLVANLGLPGLAGGDLVRAAYLVPFAGATRVTLASIADRVIDTFTLLALIVVALPIAGVPRGVTARLPGGPWWAALLAVAGAGMVVALWLVRARPALSAKVRKGWTELHARRKAVAGAVAISLGVQSAFVMTNAALAREAGVTVGLAAWFVSWPLSKLIAVLPISLGGIGVREAALVSLMAPYGAAKDAVLASGILWQTVLGASGLAGLVVTQWHRRSMTRATPSTPGRDA